MRYILFLSIFALSACASMMTTTGSNGIRFDMSRQAVLSRIQATDTIVSVNDNTIVSEGPWDTLPDIRRKTFTFSEGKLQCIRYEYLRGDNRFANVTPTNCK